MRINKLLFTICFLLTTVSVFGQNWDEIIKLTASDGEAFDYLGYSVSISGNRAIVGSEGDDDLTTDSGAAYFFELVGGIWTETQKIKASDADAEDRFGYDVNIVGDRAVVSALQDDGSGFNSGAVYVFDYAAGSWTETQKLLPSDSSSQNLFGLNTFISEDYVFVSCVFDDSIAVNSGALYVYELVSGSWVETQKLKASDAATNDQFGFAVSANNNWLMISADLDDDSYGASGSVYAFKLAGGHWMELTKLHPSDPGPADYFGSDLCVSGNTMVVGAYGNNDDGQNSGCAYVFEFVNGTWQEVQKIRASDAGSGDNFGTRVSIDNNTLVVGAPYDGDNGNSSGSAYVFEYTGGSWAETQKIISSDITSYHFFGSDVSVSGDQIIVSSPYNTDFGNNTGSVYVFGPSCMETSSSFAVTACESYTVPSGTETYISSQTVVDTILNGCGADSVMTIAVTINSVNVLTTVNGSTITADAIGAGYQWIDCADNSILNGETNSSLTAANNGSYAVIVTENGCSDTSSCTLITTVGLIQTGSHSSVSIYPNPSMDGVYNINCDQKIELVQVTDITGRIVLSKSVIDNQLLDAHELAPGQYILYIKTMDGVYIRSLLRG